MNQKENKEYRLKIGSVIISLECDSQEYAASLEKYFGQKSAENPPRLQIRLKVTVHDDIPEIPDSLYFSKIINQEGFTIGRDVVKAQFNPYASGLELSVKTILTK